MSRPASIGSIGAADPGLGTARVAERADPDRTATGGTDPTTASGVGPSAETAATGLGAGNAPSPAGASAPDSRLARRLGIAALRLGAVALGFALWWVLTEWVWRSNRILVQMGPGDAVAGLGELVADGTAWDGTLTSLRRLLGGLLAAVVVGVPLGILLGWSRLVEQASAPVVQFLRMISPLAWAPVAVAVLGVADAPVVFLVAVAAVWPVALGTSAGVRALDPRWLGVARSLGASRTEQLRSIVLPGVRPHVLTGVRLALGIAWVVLVPAEMLGVDAGLGYTVLNARDQLRYDLLAATMLLIGIVGYTLDVVVQRVLRTRSAPAVA